MTETVPTAKEIVEKIKSRGFWEITIRPLKFDRNRIKSLGDCKLLVEENKVRLRGWDYPHINSKYGIRSGIDWVENLTDWSICMEYWRMYQSGQFVHLFGCTEDWGEVRIYWSQKSYTSPGYALSIMSTLYTFTEIYEFAVRLAKRGVFDSFLNVSTTLHGMKDRRLVTLDVTRFLNDNYVCSAEKISLCREITVEEVIGQGNEFAVDDTLKVFEHFNWFKAPKRVFKEEQDKYLKGLS